MENQINITPQGSELIIRTGDALPVSPKRPIVIVGSIESPLTYLIKRMPPASDCYIIYNLNDQKIVLIDNDTEDKPNYITGQMELTEEFKSLKIGTTWNSVEALAKTLKKLRRYFPNSNQAATLVSAIRNHKSKITSDLEKSSNDRGSKKNLLTRSVETTIPEGFEMTMPIFENTEPVTFMIDIFIDASSSSVSIELDSLDAEEKRKTIARDAIEEQLKKVPEEYPVFSGDTSLI